MLKFEERIKIIHRNLGIYHEYENKYGLTLQEEETDLVEIGRPSAGLGTPFRFKVSPSRLEAVPNKEMTY